MFRHPYSLLFESHLLLLQEPLLSSHLLCVVFCLQESFLPDGLQILLIPPFFYNIPLLTREGSDRDMCWTSLLIQTGVIFTWYLPVPPADTYIISIRPPPSFWTPSRNDWMVFTDQQSSIHTYWVLCWVSCVFDERVFDLFDLFTIEISFLLLLPTTEGTLRGIMNVITITLHWPVLVFSPPICSPTRHLK
jgi:hypothetical protein